MYGIGFVKIYKLSDIFVFIPKHDNNLNFSNISIGPCTIAQYKAVETQKFLVILHIKKKTKTRSSF